LGANFCNGDFETMPDDAGLGMQARRKMVRVISVAYALALAHAVIIVALGGIHAEPLALFGLIQLTPALAVLICDPGAFRRVVELLSRTGGAGAIVQAWAVAAFAVAAPIAAAAALGLFATPYGPEVPANYPLKDFLPGIALDPRWFWLVIVLAGPMLHLTNAAGEEILWRGYLLDLMVRVFPRKALGLINGIFWAVWHFPMIILLGWDFPHQPIAGCLAIVLAQAAWSVWLVAERLRTDSLWPAIVAHAVANAMVLGLYDRMVAHEWNVLLSPWGCVGALAIGCVLLIRTTISPDDLSVARSL